MNHDYNTPVTIPMGLLAELIQAAENVAVFAQVIEGPPDEVDMDSLDLLSAEAAQVATKAKTYLVSDSGDFPPFRGIPLNLAELIIHAQTLSEHPSNMLHRGKAQTVGHAIALLVSALAFEAFNVGNNEPMIAEALREARSCYEEFLQGYPYNEGQIGELMARWQKQGGEREAIANCYFSDGDYTALAF
jgi:hypothetical protein